METRLKAILDRHLEEAALCDAIQKEIDAPLPPPKHKLSALEELDRAMEDVNRTTVLTRKLIDCLDAIKEAATPEMTALGASQAQIDAVFPEWNGARPRPEPSKTADEPVKGPK